MKKVFSKILLGLIGLLGIFFSGCASIERSTHPTIPAGQCWEMIAEIHNGDIIAGGPRDCLVRGLYGFPYEDVRRGEPVIVRTADGGTALAIAGSPEAKRETYVAKATSVYGTIGRQPIDRSLWRHGEDPGTTRVLVEVIGRSMLSVYPEHAIIAMTLGVSYGSLRAGDKVTFWDPAAGHFTNHTLTAKYADGRWTTQGANNSGLPTRMSVRVRGGATSPVVTVTTWSGRGVDPYPVDAATYIGLSGGVWKDLTSTTNTVVRN